MGPALRCRAVYAEFPVQLVVPQRVRAEPGDLLFETAGNHGRGGWRRRIFRGGPGEPPRRGRIPHVLDGWIVVQRRAVDQLLAGELRLVGVADVEVIDAEGGVGCAIRELEERPEARRDLLAEEQTQLLR